MKALLVGDVHATPEELDDCWRLIEYVASVAVEQEVDYVIFMGDLYNTFLVVRVEVMTFWRKAFDYINEKMNKSSSNKKIFALIGNHDFAGEGLQEHALIAHQDQIEIVQWPTMLGSGVAALPYVSDKNEFVVWANKLKECPTLLCHQTFEGATYDNGMYAPDGIDQNLIPQTRIISGHIHKPAQFGKITYIGAPRWRSFSDANTARSIVVYDFDTHTRQDFDTGAVCRQIRFCVDTPESPAPTDLDPSIEWRIDVRGPSEWIEKRKAELAGKARIRTFKNDKPVAMVRESDGVDLAFDKFLTNYTPKFGTSKERLTELAHARLK